MLDNKWTKGKTKLQLPALAPEILLTPGIKPMVSILDPDIGQEIILLLTEPKELLAEFSGIKALSFFVKTGLITTSYGPVYWILFYFPNPANDQRVVYENVINPKDQTQMKIYEKLANQKYWHLIMADQKGTVLNFFEFVNIYDLSDSLEQVKQYCRDLTVTDFEAARAQYESSFTVEELLNM